jgi:hypothetical protein
LGVAVVSDGARALKMHGQAEPGAEVFCWVVLARVCDVTSGNVKKESSAFVSEAIDECDMDRILFQKI